MPLCDHSSSFFRTAHTSELSESLFRLQRRMEETRRSEALAIVDEQARHAQWRDRREQLIDRLDQIDQRLAVLAGHRLPRLQLSLAEE